MKKAKAIWNCALKNDITILPNPFNILSAINIKNEGKNRENVRINMEQDIYIDIDNTSDFVKQELNRVFAT